MKYYLPMLRAICAVVITGCASQAPVSQAPVSHPAISPPIVHHPPAPPPITSNRPAVTWTVDSATANETKMAKKSVASQLKDPASARFGKIWALKGSNGERTVCGYVNAKNSFNGYTGEKMFSLLSADQVIFEGSKVLGALLPEICMPRTVK